MITSIERYVYIAAIAIIIGFGFYLRAHLINEGEAKAQAREAKAASKQKAEDDTLAQGVTSDLKNEIARLRTTQLPPPVIRMCPAARSVSKAASAAGASSIPSAASGSVSVVSGGTIEDGVDIGPGVLLIAQAADLISARGRACLEWAKGLR